MNTLADELPRQQARCQVILQHVLEIGAPGRILATLLGQSLARAEQAAASGDVVAMLQACNDLKEYSE